MNSLPELIPDENYLLSLEAEELASFVLIMAKKQMQNAMLHQGNYSNSLFRPNSGGHKYHDRQAEIEVAIAEAWNWLEVQGLIVPAPGTNGAAGWRILSRKAPKLSSSDDIRQFAKSRWIPKEILHEKIADKVWAAFIRSEFDVAAFQAMKAVEIYVREAGGFDAGDIGTDLMRKAFHEEAGPLTDKSAERSERQARSSLFAGATRANILTCRANQRQHSIIAQFVKPPMALPISGANG
jgi:uncharacterized protein (TIGR02391 family)